MLGCDAKLAAHMVLYELAQEARVIVEHHVIETQPTAYKDLLDIGQRTELAQQGKIILVRDAQAGARLGR